MFKPILQCNRASGIRLAVAAILVGLSPFAGQAQTNLSSVPLPTFTKDAVLPVKPNILMVLDDSGSMDSDYLPDWANDQPNNYTSINSSYQGSEATSGTHASNLPQYLYFNSSFNGVAYNPAIVYSPPITFDTNGKKDTSKYPSMKASATTTYTKVPNDGFGVQDSGNSSLVDNRNAYFYTTVAGEYCDSPALTNCQTLSAASGKFAYPAPLRWCSDQALTTCRGLQTSTYKYPKMAAPRIATLTITISGFSGGSVTGVTVDGKQILSATASVTSSTNSALATAVATQINACRYSLPSGTSCTVAGYFAVADGSTNVVTIYAPGATTATPAIVKSSSVTVAATSFDRAAIPLPYYFNSGGSRVRSTSTVPGENLRTVLTSTTTSYPYPGSAAKAPTRTDCAGTTCTYDEEMTNYANWWAYYRTRMQMMKTSTSQAFSALDSKDDIDNGLTQYRVGYLTINNNTTKDFVNVKDFDGAQKLTWFTQLFKAKPNNNTPLRSALSTAGQLYGGVMNGDSFRGSTVTDPLQYSCQKNYTILSTDGYWNNNTSAPNGGVGSKLDGATAVGNQDGTFARPYNDGATVQTQTRTSQLQQRLDTLSAQKGTLQKQISQLQIQTQDLQSQTAQPTQVTSQVQTSTASVTQQTSQLLSSSSQVLQSTSQLLQSTSQLQRQTAQLMKSTSTLQQTNYQLQRLISGTWTNVSSCNNTGTNCRYNVTSGPSNVSSCTPVAKSSGIGTWSVQNPVDCAYTAYSTATSATSCTYQNQDTTAPYTVGTATQCSYAAWGTAATVSSCSASAQTTATTNGTVYNASPVQCSYTTPTTPTAVGSCTYMNPSTGPNYTVATASTCSYAAYTTPTGVASCTYVNQTTATTNGTVYTPGATKCTYAAYTTPVSAGSCTYVNQDTATTNGTVYTPATKCTYAAYTAAAPVASCTYANQTTATTDGTSYRAVASKCAYGSYGTATTASACTVASQNTSTADGAVYNAAVNCSYGAASAATPVASCTVAIATTGTANGTVYTPTARTCSYAAYSGFANASSCTVAAKQTGTGNGTVYNPATNCQYTALTAFADTTACTPATASTAPNYTVAKPTNCQYRVATAYANATSCTPTTTPDASGKTTQCQYNFATAATTLTCAPAYVAGNYTNATVYNNCTTVPGNWTNATSCTATSTPDAAGKLSSCQYTAWGSWSNVANCAAAPQSAGPNYTVALARECQNAATGGTSDTLADVAAYYYNTDLRDATQSGADKTGTCTGPIIAPNTVANDLCENNVEGSGLDVIHTQHMTTHTLGLGATGFMQFSPYQNESSGNKVYVPDYWNQPSGDFYDVAHGTSANPTTGICPWQSSSTVCTWPTPAADSPANIDDLWHAAVNGHGTYFSAGDPTALAAALKNVLAQITNTPRPGTAAAAASSTPNITNTDNYQFSSSYISVDWTGELIMRRFNSDGSTGGQQWSARRMLDCATTPWQADRKYKLGDIYKQGGSCYSVTVDYQSGASYSAAVDGSATKMITTGNPTSRTIYTVGGGVLTPFTWAGLSTAQQAYFSMPWIGGGSTGNSPSGTLSQFCTVGATCMSASSQTAASGQALLNFISGDRSNEGTLFRQRAHVLGDIVASEAAYIKAPSAGYLDPGYTGFQTANANRAPTVFVGANDGMLHAFNALTGEERWAFVPSAVLPEMFHLADIAYANNHRYYVDGSPAIGDICPKTPPATCGASDWKTILVGGLNQGGKAFYALDVTDPTVPKLLWEFTNANLGYSYGNPRIGKLKDGTWVVMLSSGYNNADGLGHLFVLNANTGTVIMDMVNNATTLTGTAASATNPSGFTRIASFAPTMPQSNTVAQVYGGDLFGNVWRFDLNNTTGAAGADAQLLIRLVDGSTATPSKKSQPITGKPVVSVVNGFPLIIIGTGQYLSTDDLTTTDKNTLYGFKDPLDDKTLPNPRDGTFVAQTVTDGPCPSSAPATVCVQGETVRTNTAQTVDWSKKNGWYTDFPLAGERAVTDPQLALGTVVLNTLKPQTATGTTISGCDTTDATINAKSFQWWVDYLTGGAVEGSNNVIGITLCTCIATRPTLIRTQDGNLEAVTRVSGTTGDTDAGGADSNTDGLGGTDGGGTKNTDPTVKDKDQPTRRLNWRVLNGE